MWQNITCELIGEIRHKLPSPILCVIVTVTELISVIYLFFLLFQQLEIYEMIGQAISNSRRAGGEVEVLFYTEYIHIT